MIAAAAMCTVFVVLVNASPVLANNLYEVPVIGNMARVFTPSRNMRKTEEADVLKVNLPALENTGNSDLERRINYEIQYKMNQLVERPASGAGRISRPFWKRADGQEGLPPTEISTSITPSTATTARPFPSSSTNRCLFYGEQYFYNIIDLESGRNLTLRRLLGPSLYPSDKRLGVRRQMAGGRGRFPVLLQGRRGGFHLDSGRPAVLYQCAGTCGQRGVRKMRLPRDYPGI